MYHPDWKSFRVSLGLSQEKFGARIGATTDRISYVERISHTYRADELKAIEREFGSLTAFAMVRGGVPGWFKAYKDLNEQKQEAADETIAAVVRALARLP
jgi:transcriptional regulator with XRE-family HTH domain